MFKNSSISGINLNNDLTMITDTDGKVQNPFTGLTQNILIKKLSGTVSSVNKNSLNAFKGPTAFLGSFTFDTLPNLIKSPHICNFKSSCSP